MVYLQLDWFLFAISCKRNEKGTRCESWTVPAAVISANFLNILPLLPADGKAFKKGVSQKTCQIHCVRVKHKITFLKSFILICLLGLPALAAATIPFNSPAFYSVKHAKSSAKAGQPWTGAGDWGSAEEKIGDGRAAESTVSGADTLRLRMIPEVVIEKSRISVYNQEKRISTADSLIMEVYNSSNLGDILSVFTPAYINTAGGTGALSSVFLRGHNSYQTTVNWNGFVLNSLTLGTMDLSSVPVAATDNISVVHGASGTIAGSGNAGGSVLLENRADWENRLQLRVQSELGTFDSRYHSFSAKAGGTGVQYRLFIFTHQAENHFIYNDIFKNGSPQERIKNNSLDNKGMIHNVFLRMPGGNKLESGLWYQVREKELPALMGSYQSSNTIQRDSTLRAYAKWTKTGSRSLFPLTLRSSGNTCSTGTGTSSRTGVMPLNRKYHPAGS
jgi:hypothetical protein